MIELIELERKVPYETYLKWQEKKEDLIDDGKEPTIKKFIKFYENKIKHQSEAQYLRPVASQRGNQAPRGGYQSARGGHSYRGNRGGYRGRSTWNQYASHIDIRGGADNTRNKITNVRDSTTPTVYCIWCETTNHSSDKCMNTEHTMQKKYIQARKHNACYCCLQTTDHTWENCPQKKSCPLCPKAHNLHLHPRVEISKYYSTRDGGRRGNRGKRAPRFSQ